MKNYFKSKEWYVMQNKRIARIKGNEKKGLIRTHIENNLKNYLIVTLIFMVRSCRGCFICKQCKTRK